jgi:acyl-CoA thioester hydrolase
VKPVVERGTAPEGRTTIRVRYPETDRMNVVYHAHYLVWFEIGRTELMRELGCEYAALEERDGIFFPLREVAAHYHAPARYDDALEVHTRLEAVGGASVRFSYRVVREGAVEPLVTGFTEHAAVGRDGRPCRLPAALRRRLAGAPEAP